MKTLTKPTNTVPVIKAQDSKEFLRKFNNNKPKKEFVLSCRKAGKLFGKAK